MHIAAATGSVEALKALLDARASAHVRGMGLTVLENAKERNNKLCVELLEARIVVYAFFHGILHACMDSDVL